jgi:class 3 adenylate cyclase
MQLNIQTKLFLLLFGLTASVLFGVLLVINQTLSETILKKIVADFRQAQNVLQREQRLRYERLIDLATLIGENPTFKANVELESTSDSISALRHATVLQSVREFAALAPVDLFIVTDRRARLLARLDKPDQYGDDFGTQQSIVNALSGSLPEDSTAQLWDLDGALYQIASAPIVLNQTNIIGALTLGQRLTDAEAQAFKGFSNIDITFLKGTVPIATTLDSAKRQALHAKAEQIAEHIKTVERQQSSEPFEMELGEEEVFAFLAPLGEGESAYYLATVPKSQELKILESIRRSLLVVASVSVLLTVVLAVALGRLFSRPVLALAEAMSKVRQGDLSVSVVPASQDEIGQLAQAFNSMIVGLRERFQLARYVGSHTLEMIRQAAGGATEISLGGSRQELAVLFSDLRGFTAYSESRPPEAVIEMLNRYLGFQAELVTKHGGSVDKFVGDEMVALFSGKDALRRAVECAIDIQRMAQEVQRKDHAPIGIGIGINYGVMVLGNMGAQDRMDYTVIGSSVNLCARLCAAAKAGQILIRHDLLQSLSNHIQFKSGQIQPMQFKGFSKPLEIAEVLYD